MKKYSVSPLNIIIIFSFILIDGSLYSLLAVAFSFLHECGHILMLSVCHGRIRTLKMHSRGIGLETNVLSYKNELLVSLAGPVVSLILFLCFLPFFKKSPMLLFCCFSNLIIFTLNILPIYPLDGGRVLFCILCKKTELPTALKIIKAVSFLFLLPLCLFSVIILLETGYNLSLLIISVYLLSMLIGVKNL